LNLFYTEDNASSYYSEYDPFDYIYSGGTQYSDPVYDAVNRSTIFDKQLLSSDSGPPIGFNFPPESEVLVVGRQAPPLPPRNYSSTSGYNFGVDERLDRKKVPTKLYEDVVVKKTYDVELVAFYEMVKELRGI
jgi:phosphatidylinositol-4-phosphate 3-kinase